MKENKNSRIIDIDGQKFQVSSHFNKNTDNDIINLIYDKVKIKSNTNKLILMENPFESSSGKDS